MSLREALERVHEQHGYLTPRLIVDVATDPQDEAGQLLHDRLEWDNEVGGDRYRQIQAHRLIRVSRISYMPRPDGAPQSLRRFVAVRSADATAQYTYHPTEEVAADPFRRELVLREMEREWKTLRRRWETFEEFATLVAADLDDLAA